MTLTAIASDPLYSGTAGVIIGAVIAGIIGLGSSLWLLSLQRRNERRVIALGFRKELEIHEGWLSVSAKAYREMIPPEIWEIKNRPISTENSLYYVLRKEMFQLSSSTVDGLLNYYSHLFAAEEELRKVGMQNTQPMDLRNLLCQQDYFVELYQPVAESLETAAAMIPDLIQRLEKDGANEKDKSLKACLIDLLSG